MAWKKRESAKRRGKATLGKGEGAIWDLSLSLCFVAMCDPGPLWGDWEME